MAFNPSGTSNGTIMGNAELLKGDIAVSNITSNPVSLSQNTIQGHPLSLGVPSKKHRHDDEEQGKLFVGGLSWDTAQESLLQYFSRFGEVIDCVVMKNAETGRSRGFGFVTFSDPANVDTVIARCPHTLDGRTIDPKSCNPRSMQKPKRSNYFPKIFLGGLPSSITETDLRSFFSKYGEVCEVVIMYDQEKKKSRGFGFLSFADESACSKAVSEHFVNIQNKQVEIKRAEPRTMQGGNGFQGKDSPINMPGPQWAAVPNGHPRNLPPSYGGSSIPPPQSITNQPSVSVQPAAQTMHNWGAPTPTGPPPIHSITMTSIPPSGATIIPVSPQTPPHPPPPMFSGSFTSPSTTPNASPAAQNWLQNSQFPLHPAQRVPSSTPQPPAMHNNWPAAQPSAPPNSTVPTFPSSIQVHQSPVHSLSQPTQFPGATAMFPPPSTPQPSFWSGLPAPTPPPSSQTSSLDQYGSHPSHLPVATQQPNGAYNSQMGRIVVNPVPLVQNSAAPVPPHVVYSAYQGMPPIQSVVSGAPPSTIKPYANSAGVGYYSTTGTMNHNSTAPPPFTGAPVHGPIGGMPLPSPGQAVQLSHPSLGVAPGVVTVPSTPDLNPILSGSLGPQRGVIYNQPSQIQGYHPYRRV